MVPSSKVFILYCFIPPNVYQAHTMAGRGSWPWPALGDTGITLITLITLIYWQCLYPQHGARSRSAPWRLTVAPQ